MKEQFFIHTLPNGIRCILKQIPRSQLCYCAMTIGAGTRDELPTEHGMAHLVEHTLFKGTAKRKAYQVNCRLENLGGEINAFTSKEETVVHATALRGDFAKAVELIDDIVFHSTFPESEVRKEKEVIYDEINMYKDSPDERIYDEFEELMFGGTELGHAILGTKASLGKLTSERIANFVERNYTTDRMVFAAIGNISPGRFVAVVERYLGAEKATQRTTARTPVTPLAAPFHKEVNRSTHQAMSVWGARAYSQGDSRRAALILLSNLLGGPSAASRLNVALRERRALTYCVESAYTPLSDTGLFTIYFSCEKEKLAQCQQVLRQELERMTTVPLSPRQLAQAKRQFVGQFAISAESNENYVLSVGKSLLVYGAVDSIEEVIERVKRISAEEIMAVARNVLTDMSSLTYK